MRILFITSVHNSLSQRLAIELSRRGYTIPVSIGTAAASRISSSVGVVLATARSSAVTSRRKDTRIEGAVDLLFS
jgi:hypothetical protein